MKKLIVLMLLGLASLFLTQAQEPETAPRLTTLALKGGNFVGLKLKGGEKLQTLRCDNNQLDSLDVSGCTALIILYCRNNQLTSLDVSGCIKLTSLLCNDNQLINLNISGCESMAFLKCNNNQLTKLDVSGCAALGDLYCENNLLTNLNVSDCKSIEFLYCENNLLTSLDVRSCTAMKSLGCNNNRLTSLDVTHNADLESLDCHGNQVASLDVSKNTNLGVLACSSNQLTSLDVSHNANLQALACSSNQLTGLNLDSNKVCQIVWCDSNHIPLSNFYPLMSRRTTRTDYLFSPQSDSVSLGGGAVFDLSKEMQFGSSATKWSVLNPDSTEVDNGIFEENNGRFRFLRKGDYRLVLQNDSVRQQYMNIQVADPTVDSSAVVFTWKIRVLSDAYFVSVQANNPDWGTVSITGSAPYVENTDIRISATPNEGYYFVFWLNGKNVFGSKAKPDTTFKATMDLTLTAYFDSIRVTPPDPPTPPEPPVTIDSFTIALQANHADWGVVRGGGKYAQDSTVIISATANQGYRFVNWKRGNALFTTKADTTFKATMDLTLTAYFDSIRVTPPDPPTPPEPPIVIDSFTIVVQANNADWGVVRGGGKYAQDSTVAISATANQGYRFIEWKKGGTLFTTKADTTFKASMDLTLTAYFDSIPKPPTPPEPETFTVIVRSNDTTLGKATITGNGSYKKGDKATITAKPTEKGAFVKWLKNGQEFGTLTEYTFDVTEDMVFLAYFEDPSDPYVYAIGSTICISKPAGTVKVFNVIGQFIYQGTSLRIPVSACGMYLVRIGNKTHKVVVR